MPPPSRRPPDADEKRLRAEITSLRINSAWAKARRRERLRWFLTLAAVAAAAVWVPWSNLKARALEALHVELRDVDAGTP